jgi:hypothetical protein
MSDSDVSIPQKVAALAKALAAVRQGIGVGSGMYRPFRSWFRKNGPNANPLACDSRDRRKSCVKAAVEFVEAVDTANRTLNALPASVLKPLSALIEGVPWDVRTRRTLRAIQYEASFLKSLSMDPSMLDLLLSSMGEDGFRQRQSKLLEFRLELTERLLDLNSLPDDQSEPTSAIPDERGTPEEHVVNPNGNAPSAGGLVVLSSAMSTEQKDSGVGTLPEKPKQTAKDRESAFDEAISGYANSDWKRDRKLTNKAWRVRSGEQKGELFGEDANERGWYQSKTGEQVIRKDKDGAWVYLTASHSKELKKFFSAFVN